MFNLSRQAILSLYTVNDTFDLARKRSITSSLETHDSSHIRAFKEELPELLSLILKAKEKFHLNN